MCSGSIRTKQLLQKFYRKCKTNKKIHTHFKSARSVPKNLMIVVVKMKLENTVKSPAIPVKKEKRHQYFVVNSKALFGNPLKINGFTCQGYFDFHFGSISTHSINFFIRFFFQSLNSHFIHFQLTEGNK